MLEKLKDDLDINSSELENDDLMESIDEMIFDDDDDGEDIVDEISMPGMEEEAPGEEKEIKEEKKSDDEISEEDLEKLLIGIDEENGILDIPDEEEVLEELKFVDEIPNLEEDELPKKEEKSKEKKKINLPKLDIIKYKDTVFKYKYYIAGVIAFFLISTIFVTKLMVDRQKSVKKEVYAEASQENQTTTNAAVVITEKTIEENLSEIEKLAYYKEKLKENPENEEMIKQKIEEVKKELKEKEKQEVVKYVKELKTGYILEFKSIKPTLFKIANDNLIMGFVMKDNNMENIYNELYLAIADAFEKNENVLKINLNLFAVEGQLKKKLEINVHRYEYNRVKESEIKNTDKLLAFDTVDR
jgi:large-conductance mechanosensitive channel